MYASVLVLGELRRSLTSLSVFFSSDKETCGEGCTTCCLICNSDSCVHGSPASRISYLMIRGGADINNSRNKSESEVAQSCLTLCDSMDSTVAYQDPQSMGFSRQEYWSGLPFPSPGALPDPRIEPASPAL